MSHLAVDIPLEAHEEGTGEDITRRRGHSHSEEYQPQEAQPCHWHRPAIQVPTVKQPFAPVSWKLLSWSICAFKSRKLDSWHCLTGKIAPNSGHKGIPGFRLCPHFHSLLHFSPSRPLFPVWEGISKITPKEHTLQKSSRRTQNLVNARNNSHKALWTLSDVYGPPPGVLSSNFPGLLVGEWDGKKI